MGADLVLFVITNELFNPRLAEHFRYIAEQDGLNLKTKTAIIVNKIDRENNPDEIIVCEVKNVIGEDSDIPIWLCSASKYLDSQNAPEKLRNRFVKQSRMNELVHSIDSFIRNAGAMGRLATPLQIIEGILEQAELGLVDDEKIKKELELIRRQKRILSKLDARLIELSGSWKQKVYLVITQAAESTVTNISGATTEDDLDSYFISGMKSIEGDRDSIYDGFEAELMQAIEDAEQELSELGESPLCKEIDRVNLDREKRANVEFNQTKPKEGVFAAQMTKKGMTPLKEGLKKAADNAKGMRDVVYNAGKKFGKKFRPWEAVKKGEKLAEFAGKVGKAVPFLAFALDLYINYHEEKDKEKKERYLANMRISLRETFADQAKMESDAFTKATEKISEDSVGQAKEKLNDRYSQITSSNTKNVELAEKIKLLKKRSNSLRTKLSKSSNHYSEL